SGISVTRGRSTKSCKTRQTKKMPPRLRQQSGGAVITREQLHAKIYQNQQAARLYGYPERPTTGGRNQRQGLGDLRLPVVPARRLGYSRPTIADNIHRRPRRYIYGNEAITGSWATRDGIIPRAWTASEEAVRHGQH